VGTVFQREFLVVTMCFFHLISFGAVKT
jgi:hypothetical protein